MRNKKFQMTWYQANDTAAMERKLEQMAQRGWLLDKVTNWGWHYRRAEPQTVKYTMTFFPDASIFDSAPTEGQETYADYCAAAGWEFVSGWGPMQFFRSTRPDPIPIETDEEEKLHAIHKSMLKTWIFSYGLLIVSMLLNLSTRISSLKYSALSTFSSNGDIALLALLIITLVYLAAFLVDYFIWYVRSKKAVERGEACLQPHTKARLWASFFLLMVCAGAILAWVADISSPGMAWVWVYAFGGMALILALSQGLMALMKKRGASRGATKTAFVIAAVLLSVAYSGCMIPLFAALDDAGLMRERQPVYVYTEDHYGMELERDIYRDDIPVTLEELGYTVTEADHSSYEADRSRSILMTYTVYIQNTYGEDSELPYLEYQVVEPKWSWLRDSCLDWVLNYRWYDPMQPAEDPRWGADQVYVPSEGHDNTRFCLVYGNRIVHIDTGWSLTDEQIAVIVEKLNVA